MLLLIDTAAQAHWVEVDDACLSEAANAFLRKAQPDAAAALLRRIWRMRSPSNDAYSNTMAYLRKAGRDAEVLRSTQSSERGQSRLRARHGQQVTS